MPYDDNRTYVKERSQRPTITAMQVFNPTPSKPNHQPKLLDYHKGYSLLLSVLIKYESNAHLQNNTTIPGKFFTKNFDLYYFTDELVSLSGPCQWVLNQYAQMYGVGELYRRLV